ncbi:MAG: PqqD family peptide modification chaperone [Gammaproteobacteria bacterium]|nr:PqqD family peptide modification chaperone [Gammaproteobacteria bacterium]
MNLPHPHPDIHFLPFLDGAALFHPATQRLWVLNSTLAYIWCSLEAFRHTEKLALHLASTFTIGQATAEQDLQTALEQMQREGLLEGCAPQPVIPNVTYENLLSPQGPALQTKQKPSCQLEILNAGITVAIEDAALRSEVMRIYAPFLTRNKVPSALSLAVLPADNRPDHFDIFINNHQLDQEISRERVIPILVTAIFQQLSRCLGKQLAFHSAVLSNHGKTLIMPAISGAGKSTLSAALMTQGWHCLSDELAIIDPRERILTPMPLPMSIKPGSIEPLHPYYPDLENDPLHHRADGKEVRYLPIETRGSSPQSNRHRLSGIVLPQYNSDKTARLTTLPKTQALERMAETGSSERPLTLQDIQALITIVEETPCYQLTYRSTREAINMLDQSFRDAP